MRRGLPVASVLLAGAALGALAVRAEEPSIRFEKDYSHKPVAVVPVPQARVAEDTEQAVSEIRAREQAGAVSREMVRTPERRPDLGQDVVDGIQLRNLRDALRR